MLERMRLPLAMVASVGACSASSEEPIALGFVADPGGSGEAYICFGFDAGILGGEGLGGIEPDAPAGPVALHHVALYASPSEYGLGPAGCEVMPGDAVPLHVWATGGGPLALPPDVE